VLQKKMCCVGVNDESRDTTLISELQR